MGMEWFEKWNLDVSIDLVYAASVDEADAVFENEEEVDNVLCSTIIHELSKRE